jgi:hypothetical protein
LAYSWARETRHGCRNLENHFGLELEVDARMIVKLVVMMIMKRFQDDNDDNKNNTKVVSSVVDVSGCE